MGYPDIVEEFEHLDDEMIRFLDDKYYDKPWDIDNIRIRLGLTYKRAREVMEQLNQSGIVGPLSEKKQPRSLLQIMQI